MLISNIDQPSVTDCPKSGYQVRLWVENYLRSLGLAKLQDIMLAAGELTPDFEPTGFVQMVPCKANQSLVASKLESALYAKNREEFEPIGDVEKFWEAYADKLDALQFRGESLYS